MRALAGIVLALTLTACGLGRDTGGCYQTRIREPYTSGGCEGLEYQRFVRCQQAAYEFCNKEEA